MILVTGGCGLIASNLPGDDLVFTDLLPGVDAFLDVTDAAQTEAVIRRYQPSAVVHCAAWIDPDQCERDPAGCFRVNVIGTMNVLAACRAVGARLVYLSTQLVFDGEKRTPYTEEDPVGPLQQYGQSHFCAEQYVRSYANHLILRTSLCHGYRRNGEKYGFIYWVLDELRTGKTIEVVDAFWTTPVDVRDLGSSLRVLLDREAQGTYHYGGEQFLSRYEYAVQAAKKAGLDASMIRPIGVESLMKKWIARRPLFAGLDSSRITRDFGLPPSDALAAAAHDYRKEPQASAPAR
jgi:dTDP-4-dehydrorhamnose reductase